jgi:UDP-2,4-diacetamido-2,4,6-trideoxy-beta-L-altropyranose hydrolase
MIFFFRVDANEIIGSGHLSRCLSLCEFLKKNNHKVTLISRPIENDNFQNLKKKFNIKILRSKNLEDDAKETLNIILKDKNPFLFVDGYHLNLSWQRIVKKKIKKLYLITEYNKKKLKNLVSINPSQNIYDKKNNYFGFPLISQKYNFKDYLKRFDQLKKNRNIIISFGSSDNENYTNKICSLINPKKFKKYNFWIIIGKYYKYEKSLKESYFLKNKNVKVIKNKLDLSDIFKNTRMAIVTASVISRELLNYGIPCLIIKVSDNQKFNSNFYKKKRIFLTLDKKDLITKKKFIINKLILDTLKINFKKYLKIISHISVDVFNKIFYLITKSSIKGIYLDKVKVQDFIFLYNLINQKKNRKNSFNNHLIKIEEHHNWFKKRVINDGSNIFILKDLMDTRLGQCRFDLIKQNYYLDYSIDEKFQQNGLGKKIINLALKKMNNRKENIYAKVLKKNIPSNKIFRSFCKKSFKDFNVYKLK